MPFTAPPTPVQLQQQGPEGLRMGESIPLTHHDLATTNESPVFHCRHHFASRSLLRIRSLPILLRTTLTVLPSSRLATV